MNSSDKTPFGLVLLIWIAGLGAAMQFSKFSFIFSELPSIYPDAGIALGFLVSILSFLGILLGLFAGLFVTRIGFNRVLIGSLLIGAAMSYIQGFLPPLNVMLFTRLIEGLSQVGMVVAAPTLISQISAKRHRGFTLSLWGTFFGVAYAITNVVAAPIVETFGIGGLFFSHGAALTFMAIVLMFALPVRETDGRNATVPKLWHIPALHLQIYSSPFVSAAALGWLCYTLTFVSLLTLLPERIAPADRLFVVTAMPLAGIISSMTIGVALLRFISAYRVIIIGFFLAAICALCVVLWPALSLAYVALFAAMGLVQGASFALIPQLNETAQDQANANGAQAQMGNLGNTVGTPMLLALFGLWGFGGMMGAVVALFAIGICLHVWMNHRRNLIVSA